MNDEWKMPGTEQEENQQPVGEESEVTEATAVKEPEAGETAEAMPEATESQEPEVSERVDRDIRGKQCWGKRRRKNSRRM